MFEYYGWGCVPQVEHLSTSLFRMAEKLERLGFQYDNGKVIYLETDGEQHHV